MKNYEEVLEDALAYNEIWKKVRGELKEETLREFIKQLDARVTIKGENNE